MVQIHPGAQILSIIMKISELISELEKIKEKEGDLVVDIKAKYDGSYYTGNDLDEIEVCNRTDSLFDEKTCKYYNVEVRVVQLTSETLW